VDEWLVPLVSSPLGLQTWPSWPWQESLLVQELQLERFLQTFCLSFDQKSIFKFSKIHFELMMNQATHLVGFFCYDERVDHSIEIYFKFEIQS
jgi:hypothetical protein